MERLIVRAKYASACETCGERIAVGEKVLWRPRSRPKHLACPGKQYERPSLPTPTIASNPALLTAGIDSVHEPTRVSRGLPCEDGQTTTPNRPLRSR